MTNQPISKPESLNPTAKETTFLRRRVNFLSIISFLLLLSTVALSGFIAYTNYVPSSNVNSIEKLIQSEFLYKLPTKTEYQQGVLKGVVGALNDPYSEYLPAEERKDFQNELNKRYKGIGVVFDFKEAPKVIVQSVIPDSPAKKAGVQDGDVLLKIDNQNIQNLTQTAIVEKIRGEANTVVTLQLARESKGIFDLPITRGEISLELIKLDFKDDAAVITIISFGENLDVKMQEVAGKILANKSIKRVIVDVRGNPGGLLNEAVDVLSYFVPNDTLLVQEKGKNDSETLKSVSKSKSLIEYPVSVVMSNSSASASEILAGALRDQRGAKLIGQTSYGKGVVQKIFNLNNGDSVKLTVAEWLTPKGETINKTGLKPDVEVDIKEDSLKKALELK